LVYGFVIETTLVFCLCYCYPLMYGLGTRDLSIWHTIPAMPFSCLMLVFDETKKLMMRIMPNGKLGEPNWWIRFAKI